MLTCDSDSQVLFDHHPDLPKSSVHQNSKSPMRWALYGLSVTLSVVDPSPCDELRCGNGMSK